LPGFKHGGVIQQTPFCVFNIAVEHPKRQTSPNPFVESTLDGHADLLKISRLPFSGAVYHNIREFTARVLVAAMSPKSI